MDTDMFGGTTAKVGFHIVTSLRTFSEDELRIALQLSTHQVHHSIIVFLWMGSQPLGLPLPNL